MVWDGHSPRTTQDSTETTAVDPGFVNPALGDYRLQTTAAGYPANSPAIDNGATTVGGITLPYNGLGARHRRIRKHDHEPGNRDCHRNRDGFSGDPLAAATLAAAGAGSAAGATTDASGHYTLSGVLSGIATVTAAQAGYVTTNTEVVVSSAGTSTSRSGDERLASQNVLCVSCRK